MKWCAANGFIVVGDRKPWSTLSDSPTLPGLLVREGKFVRRTSALNIQLMYENRGDQTTGRVSRHGRVSQKQKLFLGERASVSQLIKSRPLQRHRTKKPTEKQTANYKRTCATRKLNLSALLLLLPDLEAFPTTLPMNKIRSKNS